MPLLGASAPRGGFFVSALVAVMLVFILSWSFFMSVSAACDGSTGLPSAAKVRSHFDMTRQYDNPEELTFPEEEVNDNVEMNGKGVDKLAIKRMIADKMAIMSAKSADKVPINAENVDKLAINTKIGDKLAINWR
jgi:hypothetical protein